MTYTLLHNDAIAALRELPSDSLDSCVCDPPYGLSQEPNVAEVMQHWINGDTYQHGSNGFMGRSWDSFVPGPEYWREVYRVLKPGGYLLAFSGTRTWDLLSIAIRFAGFENRDTINVQGPPAVAWVHGQGFPKSHDISKAIDRMAGAEREVISTRTKRAGDFRGGQYDRGGDYPDIDLDITAPATDAAKQWAGFGTALKPAWEVVLMCRKPIAAPNVASNVLAFGCGAINVDACRVPGAIEGDPNRFAKTDGGDFVLRFNDAPVVRSEGRWPPNLVLSHAEGCQRVGVRRVKGGNDPRRSDGSKGGQSFHGYEHDHRECNHNGYADADGLEAVEEWRCVDGCPVQVLGQQSGESTAKASMRGLQHSGRHGGLADIGPNIKEGTNSLRGHSDTGTAARFFPCFQVDEYDTFPYNSRNVWEADQCPAKQAHGENFARVTDGGIATGERPEAANYTDNLSTDGCGSKQTAQSLTDATSTISTTIQPITGSKTLHASPQNSTTTIISGYESGTSSAQTASSGDNANDASDTSRLTSSASVRPAPITDTAKPAPLSMCVSGGEPTTSATEHTSAHTTTHTNSDPSKSHANTVAACSCQRASVVGSAPSLAETKPHTTEQNSFFPTFTPDYDAPFLYCPKSSRAERNRGLEGMPVRGGNAGDLTVRGNTNPVCQSCGASRIDRGYGVCQCVAPQWKAENKPQANTHPTVKSISLMRWLVRLVTPPNGTVLDCFMGSGSTGVAAVLEGFNFIGIEREQEYLDIAQARIAHADGGVLEIERTVTRRVTVEETERTVVRVKARDLQLALWEDA